MQKKPILIGFGVDSITPQEPVLLRGQTYQRISTGVHDPLLCNVMAIGQTKEDAVFWCSLDLTQFSSRLVNRVVKALQKDFPGFERGRLIMSAIHTHTAPFEDSEGEHEMWGEAYRIYSVPEGVMVPEVYRDTVLIPGIVSACKKAYAAMAPAGVSPILGHAVLGHCRRVVYRDGTSQMYGDSNTYNFERLEGPSDDSIEMIYVYDLEKTLIGLFLNVCCPAQTVEHKRVCSADYVGAFRQQLAKKLGKELPVVTIIGAAGDISPRDLVRTRKATDPYNPNRQNPDPTERSWNRGEANMHSFEGVAELGRRLVNVFEYDRDKADANIEYEVEFFHSFEFLPTLLRTVSQAEYAAAKKKYQAMIDKYNGDFSAFTLEDRSAVSLEAGICARFERQKKCAFYDTPLHIMRIGSCGLVTCPYELYLEYGLRIRARANCEHLLIAELTDDETEYLPTPFAVNAKSYSALVSNQLVSCEGGEFYTESAIRRINDLF